MRSPRPIRMTVHRDNQTRRPLLSSFGFLFKFLGVITSGGTFLLGLFILLTIGKSGDWLWKQVAGWTTQPQPAPQIDVRSVVVKQVQEVSELTTALFTMEAIVPTQQDATMGGVVIGSTKLLYVASGEVRAGIDLSKIALNDIQTQGDNLTIRLPMPKLLDSKIDINRSNVYDYNRGVLGLGPDVAPQLQSLAQQKALQKITDAACEKGILTQANDRAKLVLSQLLKSPIYKTITVAVQTPDINACKASALTLAPSPNPTLNPDPSSSPSATIPQLTPSVNPQTTPQANPLIPKISAP